jgi:hypothetical protein
MDPNDKPHPGLGSTSLLDYARDLEEYIHPPNSKKEERNKKKKH